MQILDNENNERMSDMKEYIKVYVLNLFKINIHFRILSRYVTSNCKYIYAWGEVFNSFWFVKVVTSVGC